METALVLVLDDAEPFDEVRREFAIDTFALGIPFHVTLLYPFAPREQLTDTVLDDARSVFATQEPFELTLTRLAPWPRVVYAVPEPDAVLRDLMRSLFAAFPQWPPYGGEHADVVPHATIAEDVDASRAFPEIERRLGGTLPARYTIDAASLLEEFEPDRWRERERFRLGAR